MKKYLIIAIFCLFWASASGQDIPVNEYGLRVVNTAELYRHTVAADSNKKLVNLEEYIPGIKLDIKYATTENVTKHLLYDTAMIFLRLPAAKALKSVQEELKKHGLELLIHDTYRPYAVTKKIWEFVLDENYAASPKTGSRHNRGCAVDLTVIDSKTGKELEMPTEYDDFTEKAHHDYMNFPQNVIINRALLKNIMERFGFIALGTEWWHYDFEGYKNYEIMDISFRDLVKKP